MPNILIPEDGNKKNNHIDNLTSPMYSTGIGLVLKGFEAMEKNMPTTEAASAGSVKTHSEKNRGSFFDSIIKRGASWFSEDD